MWAGEDLFQNEIAAPPAGHGACESPTQVAWLSSPGGACARSGSRPAERWKVEKGPGWDSGGVLWSTTDKPGQTSARQTSLLSVVPASVPAVPTCSGALGPPANLEAGTREPSPELHLPPSCAAAGGPCSRGWGDAPAAGSPDTAPKPRPGPAPLPRGLHRGSSRSERRPRGLHVL